MNVFTTCAVSAEEGSGAHFTVYTTPIGGMQAAQDRIEQAASRIARFPAAAPGSDSVDLSAEMIALLKARNDFAANVKAQDVMDETTQSALDLVG